MRATPLLALLGTVLVCGCSTKEAPPPPPREHAPLTPDTIPPPPPSMPPVRSSMREILPGVRADVEAKVVEFDGIVPIDCHNPRTPDVYLEVVVCTPDTKEHESLVMTRAAASNIHAALLAIGLTPGTPGSWKFENKTFTPVAPTGPGVEVTLVYKGADGKDVEASPADWIVNASNKARFADQPASGRGWVFAGSKVAKHEGKEFYDADGVGTVVGLCTFGSETLALKRVISPDASIEEPEWIADTAKVPAFGTKVTVRLRPAIAAVQQQSSNQQSGK